MTITIDGNGIITGASTLATTVASPTLTTPNINSAQFATVTGTAPIYPCRAWVNFNGTGTVAIRDSGNVTSITDNGTGDYTVNFTTALADANFAAVCSGVVANSMASANNGDDLRPYSWSTSSVSVNFGGANVSLDAAYCNVAIFR